MNFMIFQFLTLVCILNLLVHILQFVDTPCYHRRCLLNLFGADRLTIIVSLFKLFFYTFMLSYDLLCRANLIQQNLSNGFKSINELIISIAGDREDITLSRNIGILILHLEWLLLYNIKIEEVLIEIRTFPLLMSGRCGLNNVLNVILLWNEFTIVVFLQRQDHLIWVFRCL